MDEQDLGWQQTRASLSDLTHLLTCGVCKELKDTLCTLQNCEHFFCSSCISNLRDDVCPTCSLPFHIKNIQQSRQLNTALGLCQQLRKLLIIDATQTSAGENMIKDEDEVTEVKADEKEEEEVVKKEEDSTHVNKASKKLREEMPSQAIAKRTRKATTLLRKKQKITDSNQMWGIRDAVTPPSLGCSHMTSPGSSSKWTSQESCSSCRKLPRDNRKVIFALKESSGSCEKAICDDEMANGLVEKEIESCNKSENLEKDRDIKDDEHLIHPYDESETGIAIKVCRKRTRKAQNGSKDETIDSSEISSLRSERYDKCKNGSTSFDRKDALFIEKEKENMTVLPNGGTPVIENAQLKKQKQCSNNAVTTPDKAANLKKNIRRGKKKTFSPKVVTPVRAKPHLSSGSPSVGSPNLTKRNAKGETGLHVAVIKGDTEKVLDLLKEGANPNVKDNAGWTPLHEACNHGHTQIAEMLLQHGGLVNMPGMDHDTPLHDAVQNYRIDCVRLLVASGASISARNIYGLSPLDCSKTAEMRDALLKKSSSGQANVLPSTPVFPVRTLVVLSEGTRRGVARSVNNLGAVSGLGDTVKVLDIPQTFRCVGTSGGTRQEPAIRKPAELTEHTLNPVFLATGLTREQRVTLQKCASLLHGKVVSEFCPEVSHVITAVNAQGMCPRTLKYLHAVLTGKWILNFEWVKHCIDNQTRVCEEAFEVPGSSTNPDSLAARKGRINRQQQLPGLFSGCNFYFQSKMTYPTPPREELSQLVKNGGGNVFLRLPKLTEEGASDLTVPYHAATDSVLATCRLFLIHDEKSGTGRVSSTPKCSDQHQCSVPASWLMDCIANFLIKEITGDFN